MSGLYRLRAAFLLAAAAVGGAAGIQYIDRDRGGNVLAYVQHYQQLQALASGTAVIIARSARSSCRTYSRPAAGIGGDAIEQCGRWARSPRAALQ